CLSRVDWNALLREPPRRRARYYSVRGKNLRFMEILGQALQLDDIEQPAKFADFKNAFTPKAVQEIYEAIPEIWPDGSDYQRCVAAERPSVSALYTGTYTPEAVIRAVTRHSLYSERIFLVDPFAYASAM